MMVTGKCLISNIDIYDTVKVSTTIKITKGVYHCQSREFMLSIGCSKLHDWVVISKYSSCVYTGTLWRESISFKDINIITNYWIHLWILPIKSKILNNVPVIGHKLTGVAAVRKKKGRKPPACAMNHWNLQGKQKKWTERGDEERGGREREGGWEIKEHNCEEKICFFHQCIIKWNKWIENTSRNKRLMTHISHLRKKHSSESVY